MRKNRLFALVLASTMLWSTVGAKDVQSAEPENPEPENPNPENPEPEKPESGNGEAVKAGDTASVVLRDDEVPFLIVIKNPTFFKKYCIL